MTQLRMEIIAGSNGTGKTTLAKAMLKSRGIEQFINANLIAQGMDFASRQGAEINAGKIMLNLIHEAIKTRKSFGFETTLSGRIWQHYIASAKDIGFEVTLFFVTVRTVDTCLKRIQHRVLAGGHNIPVETVTRRFLRSHQMFKNLYSKICDKWYVFDNSHSSALLIAKKENGSMQVMNNTIYQELFNNV